MLMNTLLGQHLFNDFFDDEFNGYYKPVVTKQASVMKTDIKDVDNNYEMDIELPGFAKEDLTAKLTNGYLTIAAKHSEDKEDKDEKDNYIRRERYYGECSRTFFVGDGIKEEDIKAKFENGILKLLIPKEAPKKIEESKYIAIEG